MQKSALALVKSILVIAIVGCSATTLRANVSLKNGNFYVGYTDIVYPGGFEPKVERVYNAKSPFKGIYGWGWGNEFENYLQPLGDGTAVLHAYGGGAEERFEPPSPTAAEKLAAVELIVGAKRKAGEISNAEQEQTFRAKVGVDAIAFADAWADMAKKGLIPMRKVVTGATFTSFDYGKKVLRKTKTGFDLAYDNGRHELYNEDGALLRVTDTNNNFLDIDHRDGKIATVKDNFGRAIRFSYNSEGLVDRLDGDSGKRAFYRYNAVDELVYSKDVDGNIYQYSYDPRHNMIKTTYSDNTTAEITYYPQSEHENVKRFKDRDNTVTDYEYVYKTLPAHGTDQSVTVKVTGADGILISTSKYRYILAVDSHGVEHTARMISSIDGDETDTTYDDRGLPTTIVRAGVKTQFRYDANAHVTWKDTSEQTVELTYDDKAAKVNFVKTTQKNTHKVTWSRFRYDDKANLVYAVNELGKSANLEYDSVGRIAKMKEDSGDVLGFQYNNSSKPIQISLTDKAGHKDAIDVTYNDSGEIDKVNSTAGRKVALKVTTAFQQLLDLIRPAGVSLSF